MFRRPSRPSRNHNVLQPNNLEDLKKPTPTFLDAATLLARVTSQTSHQRLHLPHLLPLPHDLADPLVLVLPCVLLRLLVDGENLDSVETSQSVDDLPQFGDDLLLRSFSASFENSEDGSGELGASSGGGEEGEETSGDPSKPSKLAGVGRGECEALIEAGLKFGVLASGDSIAVTSLSAQRGLALRSIRWNKQYAHLSSERRVCPILAERSEKERRRRWKRLESLLLLRPTSRESRRVPWRCR
jgi:hypothetical protein